MEAEKSNPKLWAIVMIVVAVIGACGGLAVCGSPLTTRLVDIFLPVSITASSTPTSKPTATPTANIIPDWQGHIKRVIPIAGWAGVVRIWVDGQIGIPVTIESGNPRWEWRATGYSGSSDRRPWWRRHDSGVRYPGGIYCPAEDGGVYHERWMTHPLSPKTSADCGARFWVKDIKFLGVPGAFPYH